VKFPGLPVLRNGRSYLSCYSFWRV